MSHDTWIHRLARPCVRPLARTRVTPSHLTTLRLLTGLAAIALFASGDATMSWWALALYLVSMLLDRMDGELARLTGASSEAGHRYDLFADLVCDAGLFIGIGIGQMHGSLGSGALALGLFTGVCVALVFRLVLAFEHELGSGSARFAAHAGFDPDDAIVIAPVAAALGQGTALLVVAAAATPVALFLIHLRLRRRRASSGDGT